MFWLFWQIVGLFAALLIIIAAAFVLISPVLFTGWLASLNDKRKRERRHEDMELAKKNTFLRQPAPPSPEKFTVTDSRTTRERITAPHK